VTSRLPAECPAGLIDRIAAKFGRKKRAELGEPEGPVSGHGGGGGPGPVPAGMGGA